MKVIVYVKSANHPRFAHALELFASGVAACGDTVEVSTDEKCGDCDVAVIFGSWKDRNIRHHNVKRNIIRKAKNFVVLETPLIGRGPVKEIMDDNWYRAGIGGFLADTGTFHDGRNFGPNRWETIKIFFGLDVADYHQNKSGPIVVALQLPGDASLRGASIERWCLETCTDIRARTSDPILIRLPQLPREWDVNSLKAAESLPKVSFQMGTFENLIPTLRGAKCSVTYTSGLAIDSLIHGCPAIATNPGSFAYDLVPNDFESLEEPICPSREQWLNNLSHCQWHVSEIEKGLPWKQLKPLLNGSH